MSIPSNIFLVGLMGAGKSTVGRQLAKALQKDFVDCDKALEERTGASISLIFDIEGEAGFRQRERDMLFELTERDDTVLATGGGVILLEDNRARLRSRGLVVYLNAPIELLVERTSRDRGRPLLQDTDARGRLETLLEQRDPLYRQVADITVKTDRRTARHVVRQITRQIDPD
ncbi:MAG: shikimate kinase AroK [Gammaproteobacteria bacterium]